MKRSRRTKIIATLGPASESPEMITKVMPTAITPTMLTTTALVVAKPTPLVTVFELVRPVPSPLIVVSASWPAVALNIAFASLRDNIERNFRHWDDIDIHFRGRLMR